MLVVLFGSFALHLVLDGRGSLYVKIKIHLGDGLSMIPTDDTTVTSRSAR